MAIILTTRGQVGRRLIMDTDILLGVLHMVPRPKL
jgi:hypothetical protein